MDLLGFLQDRSFSNGYIYAGDVEYPVVAQPMKLDISEVIQYMPLRVTGHQSKSEEDQHLCQLRKQWNSPILPVVRAGSQAPLLFPLIS